LSNAFQSAGYPRFSERRSHPRHHVLLSCIELENENGGIILDICEDGLSMQVVNALADDPFTQLRFQLSQSNVWVEIKGRIAWVSASKRTAGVQFVDLSQEARILLEEWISSNSYSATTSSENAFSENVPQMSAVPARNEEASPGSSSETENPGLVDEKTSEDWMTKGLAGVPRTEAKDADASETPGKNARRLATENVSDATGLGLPFFSQEGASENGMARHEWISNSSRKRQRIKLSAAVVLLLSTFGFLGYHVRRAVNGQQSRQVIAPRSVSGASSSSPLAAVTSSFDAKRSLDAPGFILQVGAMKHEENAEALAASLRQKNFPAFVIEPGTNTLYRVAVGPYSDVDSTLKDKEALRSQGFETIRTRWNPEAQ
jgi:SPOR domain/PilZ domain